MNNILTHHHTALGAGITGIGLTEVIPSTSMLETIAKILTLIISLIPSYLNYKKQKNEK